MTHRVLHIAAAALRWTARKHDVRRGGPVVLPPTASSDAIPSTLRTTTRHGSLPTLPPIFAVALATHEPRYAFPAGLATASGAEVSMTFPEGLSGTGELIGRCWVGGARMTPRPSRAHPGGLRAPLEWRTLGGPGSHR